MWKYLIAHTDLYECTHVCVGDMHCRKQRCSADKYAAVRSVLHSPPRLKGCQSLLTVYGNTIIGKLYAISELNHSCLHMKTLLKADLNAV